MLGLERDNPPDAGRRARAALSWALCCLIVCLPAGCASLIAEVDEPPHADREEVLVVGGVLDFVGPTLLGAAVAGGGGAIVGVILGIQIFLLDWAYFDEHYPVDVD